jgi:hypothetical protein
MLIAPCYAGELDSTGPSTQVYVRIPIGAAAAKERVPSYGLMIRGRQEYQVLHLDSRTLDAIASMPYDGGLIAGLELKWLLIGGAAVVGAVAVAKAGGGGSSAGPTKQGTPPPPQPDSQGKSPPSTTTTTTTTTTPPSDCTCPAAFYSSFY